LNSLSESGYIFTNSISIIDPSYTSSLKIVLTKIDESLPDLELPFKCCKLLIDKSIHYEMEEVLESDFIITK
jgi:dUTPase